jgi:hypothetical protein
MPNFRTLFITLLGGSLLVQGCGIQWGADIQWDAKDQILLSESSQVKLRTIQTRTYDTTDRNRLIRAIVSTLQDLYFDIDVLDDEFGIISGKKLLNTGDAWEQSPTYYTYKTDNLIIFSANYRTYGPFVYRTNLTRLSVTIRPKGETQLLVRASIQHNIAAVEDPEAYQTFFKLLEQSQFLSAGLD